MAWILALGSRPRLRLRIGSLISQQAWRLASSQGNRHPHPHRTSSSFWQHWQQQELASIASLSLHPSRRQRSLFSLKLEAREQHSWELPLEGDSLWGEEAEKQAPALQFSSWI